MMKRTTWNTRKTSGLAAAAAIALTPLPLSAQRTADYEYEPGEGYHQEEWYDVGDWFDSGGYEEMYTADYDDPYYENHYWNQGSATSWDGAWYDSYNYDPVDYGFYSWNPQANEWQRQQNQQRGQQAKRNQRQNQPSQKAQRNQNQNEQRAQAQRDQRQNKHQQADQRKKNPVQLSGTIDGFRRINVENAKKDVRQHTFVKVNLENGNKAIIDLGEKKGLSDLDLQKGDSIKVRGRTGQIGNRTVVRASRIKVDGEMTQLRKNRVVQGTIADIRRVNIKGADKQHTFVRLEMQDGNEIIVDFGPGTNLSDMNLRKGKEVSIRGQIAKMNGKAILTARNVQVNESQNKQG